MVAGRTCFIYYRGEPGHQKRDFPRSVNRGETNHALARSSTWGSEAHSLEHSPDTDPLGNPPAASSEQPVTTLEGLRPDSVNVHGSTATDHVSTGDDPLVVTPPGPTGLASGQLSDAVILP